MKDLSISDVCNWCSDGSEAINSTDGFLSAALFRGLVRKPRDNLAEAHDLSRVAVIKSEMIADVMTRIRDRVG